MRNVSRYIDLAFCFLFLPFMIFIFPVERWWGTYPLFFILFIGWLYITYFVYKYFIIPQLFGRRYRTGAIATVAVSLLVTFLFSSYEITSPFYHLRQQYPATVSFPVWGVRQNQQAVWLHYIVVVFFCLAVGMLTEAYRQRLAREKVEFERSKAELALYKAQINPHFLFNTLNTIYGLLIMRSDKTEVALERFINLTKYMYNNANLEWIPLAEEVAYIEQFIGLQKLRLNALADVRFEYGMEDDTVPVPPMLLITFVENAFKYGISSDEPCFIHIRLVQQEHTLRFEATNSVFRHATGDSRQTGIANCLKRLSLLYPGRYLLTYGQTPEGTFHVSLELKSSGL